MSHRATINRRGTIALALAVLLASLWAVLGLTAQDASGVAAVPLGKTKNTPKPACPKECQATGTVTAFQVAAAGEENPFKVPTDGHIVAWAVDLSKPVDSDIAAFNEKFEDKRFEGRAAARISVLKPLGRAKYKLTKQSPPVELQEHFDSQPIFTLRKPLKVSAGQRIALTLPTWAPLYVSGIDPQNNEWIASRDPGTCGLNELLDAKPQQKKGSIRPYGCRFEGERLLYWAYFVPERT